MRYVIFLFLFGIVHNVQPNDLIRYINEDRYDQFIQALDNAQDDALPEALVKAINGNKIKFVKALLVKKPSLLNEEITIHKSTPLMLSIGDYGFGDEDFSIFNFFMEQRDIDFAKVDVKGWNALMYAVQKDNVHCIEKLLEKMSYKDVNQQSTADYEQDRFHVYPKGSTPLMMAFIKYAKPTINMLFTYLTNHEEYDTKTSIGLSNDAGWNTLMVAIANSADMKIIQELMTVTNLDQQTTQEYKNVPKGVTALMIALIYGRGDIVTYFIEEKLSDLSLVDEYGRNALMVGIEFFDGDTKILERLINLKKIDLNAETKTPAPQIPAGSTALMIAIMLYKENIAGFLIKKGADITKVNGEGWDALMLAAYAGLESVVSKLVFKSKFLCENVVKEKSSLFYSIDVGSNALLIALQKRHLESAIYIMDECAINQSSEHYSALILALLAVGADKTFKEIVLKIINQKNDSINYQLQNGLSPLMIASVTGQLDIVTLLLEKGADSKSALRDDIDGSFYTTVFSYYEEPWSQLKNVTVMKKGSTALDLAKQMYYITNNTIYDAIIKLLTEKKPISKAEHNNVLKSLSTFQKTLLNLKNMF